MLCVQVRRAPGLDLLGQTWKDSVEPFLPLGLLLAFGPALEDMALPPMALTVASLASEGPQQLPPPQLAQLLLWMWVAITAVL
jgi:hypothetical protein